MDEYGTKLHISFVFKQFALFLRNPSVCGRVFLSLCRLPIKKTSAMKKILFHPFCLAALIAFSSCMDKDVYNPDCSDDGKSELDLSEGELY